MADTPIVGSILNDIKKSLGIVPTYTEFDDQLIMSINSVFSTLHQLGYGPDEGYEITDETDVWSDYIESTRMNFIKSYITMKVHVMFDPPTSSIAMESLNKAIAEYEWRINSEAECYEGEV